MGGILLKLIYSALLLGLSGVLMRELWTVWFDPQIYIGRFEVSSESGKDEEVGAGFAKRIVGAQAVTARQFVEYQTRRAADAPTDATYLLPGTAPLQLPRKALEGVDVTIQSVNLSQLLTVVRRGFLAPNEVSGHVTMREGSVLTAVEWPRAPRFAGAEPRLTQFLTPSRTSAQEAAAYVACSISWARAKSVKPDTVTFSRAQFCDFTTALGDLYALSSKASQPGGLSSAEAGLVRTRAAQLRSHYGSEIVFAEIYRLRADLLDLLPEGVRTQSELVDAQEDRLRYAMLSPKLRDLPEEEKRLAAQALARPAILLEPGKPLVAPENWAGLLIRYESAIRAAEAATGTIVRSDGSPVGTGFIVGPGLVMTAGYVLGEAQRQPRPERDAQPAQRPRLCLGPSAEPCEPAFAVGEVVYRSEDSRITIANLEEHDPTLNPPLTLAVPLPDANTLIGRYAFVIGYPFRDQRMPEPFVRRLLGDVEGRRRVMPGRILAFGVGGPPRFGLEGLELPSFTTDISTSGGTGGGPLVDLTTGAVLGMSFAGRWQGERGKFAYAEPIPKAALDLISRRARGEPDGSSSAPASADDARPDA